MIRLDARPAAKGTTMTAAELKRKLRNSPFAPLQWRILHGAK
jgi:hypothetical protein